VAHRRGEAVRVSIKTEGNRLIKDQQLLHLKLHRLLPDKTRNRSQRSLKLK
jgi:hypothetical protein